MSFERAIPHFELSLLGKPFYLIKGLRHDLFYGLLHKESGNLENLGDPAHECTWTIRTKGISPESVIYSAGVGRDISFEHALADRFGAKVLLLDPSPTGIETMKHAENQRSGFDFLPVALAGKHGEMRLAPPTNAEEGSWIADEWASAADGEMIRVRCETLAGLMQHQGHQRIDLLKMDIEGAEFEVLDSMMESGIQVTQIAVEYHNAVMAGVPRGRTIHSLWKLWRKGYRLIHKDGSNHTLLHRSQF